MTYYPDYILRFFQQAAIVEVDSDTYESMVFSAMYLLISCVYAGEFTFEGRRKRPFKDVSLSYFVKGIALFSLHILINSLQYIFPHFLPFPVAVQKRFPGTRPKVIGTRIGHWLTSVHLPAAQKKKKLSQFNFIDFGSNL